VKIIVTLIVLLIFLTAFTASAEEVDISFYQRRLTQLGFKPGPVDGIFGPLTRDAVIAFQKAYRLEVSGELDQETRVSLEIPAATEKITPEKETDGLHIEIDIEKQILLIVERGEVKSILHVSTGREDRTPTGLFHIYEKVDSGWVTAIGRDGRPQGKMYMPLKFWGPYYIHGSRSVPEYPASLGCVRIMPERIYYLHEITKIGTTVLIR